MSNRCQPYNVSRNSPLDQLLTTRCETRTYNGNDVHCQLFGREQFHRNRLINTSEPSCHRGSL